EHAHQRPVAHMLCMGRGGTSGCRDRGLSLRSMAMAQFVNRMRAVHPGEVLREEYLLPLGLSVNGLALALGGPGTPIHEIVKERRGVSADTAERLARYFGGDAASWLALQASYDLKTLATRKEILRRVVPRERATA